MGAHGGTGGGEEPARWLTTATLSLLIIGSVSMVAVLAVAAAVLSNHAAPNGLLALASAGVGSLSTFLARARD